MTSTCLVGSTGLIGGEILKALQALPSISSIHAYSRKDLPTHTKLQSITSSDTASWPAQYPVNASIFFASLGTTRRQVGSVEAQRAIDYDLNLELAKAAKEKGTKVYVLISSAGASATSSFAYPKMKGELEEAVQKLGFEHTVILRPGLIVGTRQDSRPMEYAARSVANFMGGISGGKLKDVWAQDADVIARAAIRAGMEALEGKSSEKVRLLVQGEVLKLGKAPWKDGQ